MAYMPPNTMPQAAQRPLMPQTAQRPLMLQAAQRPLMPQATQMIPVPQVVFGPEPCSVNCPSCGATVVTTVQSQPTTKTHIMALLLCCLCVCLVCVPYCIDSCQNADHLCPNCNAYLGTYKH